jgi:hypothetical protein
MKNVWIIGSLVALVAIGLILGFNGKDVLEAGDFSLGYFSAGTFSAGIFSAGLFSVGIFSVGLFSVGVFSLGIFNIGVVALGFFLIAWKKHYAKVVIAEETKE